MAINYNPQSKVFCIDTKNSTYQLCIDQYNYLMHLYYGKKIINTEMKHLLFKQDRGFAGVPNESGYDRTFSLDTLPQEFPSTGLADYRSSLISIINSDGSCAVDLRYVSHDIYKGRKPLNGLPHTYGDNIETLEILLADSTTNIEVTLFYHVIEEYDAIIKHASVTNKSDTPVVLDRFLSSCVDFNNNNYDFVSFYGRHCLERNLNRQRIGNSKISIGSTRGASSHAQNPFAIICDNNTNEDYGDCYGFSFVYSGNFIFEADVDQINQTRVVMGIHPEFFRYRLEKDECFEAPEVIHTFSANGFTELSQKLSNLINNHICRRANLNRPVVINTWEAAFFDFNEEILENYAKAAAELGIEMLVMDDGWFGKRNDDTTALGDWYVNTEKLKGGLGGLCNKINALGVDLGIWFEPEMISEDSNLYREHPDWCLNIPGRAGIRSRHQFVLDLTRQDVVDYLYERMADVLDTTNIRFIKWDMNRHLSTVYSTNLPPQRQGEVYHRYMLGLYNLLDRLVTNYPTLLIEGCSGGGGRFDLGMLYYSPQIWCSDNTDAYDRIHIQYGTSFGYPISAISAHVARTQLRAVPFSTRGAVAMMGVFGYEMNVTKLTDEEKTLVKEQIAFYKKHQDILKFGDYFRLTNPFENFNYASWQYVSKDKSLSLLYFVMLKDTYHKTLTVVKPKGLIKDANYEVCGNIYTGSALMNGGLILNNIKGDYESLVLEIKRIN